MVKRKLSGYNLFIRDCRRSGLSMSDCATEWSALKDCPTCAPSFKSTKNPKKTTKKATVRKILVPESSGVLPFILGSGVSFGVGYASRYFNSQLPLPVPFDQLAITLPVGLAVVGGVLVIVSKNKSAGFGLLVGGAVSAVWNYYYYASLRARSRRVSALRRRVGGRVAPTRLVARRPTPAVHMPMLSASSRGNGIGIRPAKLGLPAQTVVHGDLPIRPATFLHPAKLGCNGNTRPSDLPIRNASRTDRLPSEITPTYIGGETLLA